MTYAPRYTVDSEEHDSDTQVLYLVSPKGSRYKVLELPWNQDVAVLELVHWKAGDHRVLVTLFDGTYKWLDLHTGKFTGVTRPSADARWLGVASTGSTIWESASGSVFSVTGDGTVTDFQDTMDTRVNGDVLSPGRTFADIGIPVDLQTGQKRFYYEPQGTSGGCTFAGWLSESELVLGCTSASSGARVLYSTVFSTLDAVQGQPEPKLLFTDPGLAAADRVDGLPDGRWLLTGATWNGTSGVFVVDGSDVTTLQTPGESGYVSTRIVGNTVFVEQWPQDGPGTTLTAHDLSTGRSVDVAPLPADTGEAFGLGPITWVNGFISWTAAAGY